MWCIHVYKYMMYIYMYKKNIDKEDEVKTREETWISE